MFRPFKTVKKIKVVQNKSLLVSYKRYNFVQTFKKLLDERLKKLNVNIKFLHNNEGFLKNIQSFIGFATTRIIIFQTS